MKLILAGQAIGIAAAFLFIRCKNPEQAANAVFTTEQIVCMSTGMIVGGLSGEPQVIAQDLVAECGILPQLTQDVISFIETFQKQGANEKAKWTHAPTSPAGDQ